MMIDVDKEASSCASILKLKYAFLLDDDERFIVDRGDT